MNDPLIRAINKMMAPLQRRINNMLARGVITALQDNQGLQLIQATLNADEVVEGAERLQEYGFTSNPPLGSEIVALFVGGDRSHPVILAVDNRAFRLKDLDAGDTAIYSLAGNFIKLTAEDGKIYIDAPGNVIVKSASVARLEAPQIELCAETKIKWDCGGRGYDYYPTHTDTWEVGSVPGQVNNITPPEHPPAGAI